MVKLSVRLVGVDPSDKAERVLATVKDDSYDPDRIETHIATAFELALKELGAEASDLAKWEPEVSISLTADGEHLRPSFHLSAALIQVLAAANASFDFDPYI